MHGQSQPKRVNLVPAILNSNYGNHLKHQNEVMHVKELTNHSLKLFHNVPIVIHATAELSVALLKPDLILRGETVLH